MSDSLWFFTDEQNRINLGSKPSNLGSFVVLTRTVSEVPFQEQLTEFDLNQMGYNQSSELMNDPDYHSKVRIYVRKKYGDNTLENVDHHNDLDD